MSPHPLPLADAAARLKDGGRRGALLEQAGVAAAGNSAAGAVFRRMLDGLEERIATEGVAEVALTYEQWADLANLDRDDGRRGGKWTTPGSLRKPFAEWEAGVYGDDAGARDAGAPAVTVRVTVFTPGAPGKRGGLAGMRCRFERGDGTAIPLAPPPPGRSRSKLARDVRRGQEARRRRGVVGAAAAAFLGSIGAVGGTTATSFRRWCARHKVPVLLAVLLIATALVACAVAARWAWVRFRVRPARVQEATAPIPPYGQRDRPVGSIPIAGEAGDWSGTIDVRSRPDGAYVFTYRPTVPLPCPAVAGEPQRTSYAWRFSDGTGFTAWERSGSVQAVHRFPPPPVQVGVQLVPSCGATYGADLPGFAPGSSATITATRDAQGQLVFDVHGQVAADRPIPGATVVPAPPPTAPPAVPQPDPKARSR